MVTLAIWGDVTPGAILTKCGLWGDTVDVITCAIFRDCRLKDVGVVRWINLPSPLTLVVALTTVVTLLCVRVICQTSDSDRSLILTVSRPKHRFEVTTYVARCIGYSLVSFTNFLTRRGGCSGHV